MYVAQIFIVTILWDLWPSAIQVPARPRKLRGIKNAGAKFSRPGPRAECNDPAGPSQARPGQVVMLMIK